MNIEAVNQFIGTDWEYGTNDCWAVFVKASKAVFNIDLPAVAIPERSSEEANAVLFNLHANRRDWVRIEEPENGCAVLFRDDLGNAVHIGLHVENGNVLHCAGTIDKPGRTSYCKLRRLFGVYHRTEFYKYAPNNSCQ